MSILKLKEDEQKYKNEQALAEADLKVKELELNIFRKSLAETRRTLEDAQIRSPRKAILTYVNNEIGSQIGQGAKVAIVSDLSHFKIEGEIAVPTETVLLPAVRRLSRSAVKNWTGRSAMLLLCRRTA